MTRPLESLPIVQYGGLLVTDRRMFTDNEVRSALGISHTPQCSRMACVAYVWLCYGTNPVV